MTFMAPKIVGSPQQKAVWSAMRTKEEHLLVEARAGSGKTFTLVHGLKKMTLPDSVLFAAFNKSVQQELSMKLPHSVECRTLHSFGFKVIRENREDVGPPNNNKIREILGEIGPEFGFVNNWDWKKGQRPAVWNMVGLFRNNGLLLPRSWTPHQPLTTQLVKDLTALKQEHSIDWNAPDGLLYNLVAAVVYQTLRSDDIDFDDMIYWPFALGLEMDKYDLVLVDEFQDTNLVQQDLVYKSADRLIVTGDRHQSIYGFRGADADAIPRAEKMLSKTKRGLISLPLTVSRRCSVKVIELAQRVVPDIEAMKDAKRGHVTKIQPQKLATLLEPGDMVVCRCNAPLIELIYKLYAKGRRAFIEGRKIGDGLTRLVDHLLEGTNDESLSNLGERLKRWETSERTKLKKENAPVRRLIALMDKCDCLRAVIKSVESLDQLLQHLEELFQDDVDLTTDIRLSSVHRAKGLEAERVVILQPELIPHPLASTKKDKIQEKNILYAAITRTIDHLYFAGTPKI